MQKIHLICNPISGKGSAAQALNRIKDWAKFQTNLDLVIHVTENIGHATIITKDITSNKEANTILVLGGDGTVNEVLNGIEDFSNTYIGILPFGSGNDFAYGAGIKNDDPVALINTYINSPIVRKVDYMILNDKYRAINSVGLGISAETILYRDKMKHFSPKVQYTIATIRKGMFWKSFKYTLTIDGGTPTQIDSMWFTISNGCRIGGGFFTAPDAIIDDGVLNVMYVKKYGLKLLRTPSIIAKTKKRKIAQVEYAVRSVAKEINLELHDNAIEYDGNILEHQNRCNVKIVNKGLNLLTEVR